MTALVANVASDGGLVVMNHPREEGGPWGYATTGGAAAFEVWNIHWLWRDDGLTPVKTSRNDLALAYYDSLLSQGARLPAVGGSDNHWRATSGVQGVGQPTTWVLASSATEAGILDGIRAGRTFVSWDWFGPKVRVDADADGDGVYELPMGTVATVPAGSDLRVRVTVEGGAGHSVRLVVDGQPGTAVLITGPSFQMDAVANIVKATSIRANVQAMDSSAVRAISSPVYAVPTS